MRKLSLSRLIAASDSWAEFFAAVSTLPTEADKGEAFERLTELYLKTKPEYATKLAHVWRIGKDLPPRIRKKLRLPDRDEGIDLIAETKDGAYWAIQCKFRTDTDKALTRSELSTFTSLAFHSCQGIAEAVVAHTSAKPVKKRALLPQTTEIGLERWLQTTPEDWKRVHAVLGGRPQRPKRRKPHDHQEKAIAAATAHFVENKATRGRLIMPCGTGKSLTAFWITNALKARKIVVAVPSLALIRQSLEDWTREFVAQNETPVPDWLCVCSDESVGKMERDEFVSGVYDLGIPATTDEAEIAEFLSRRTRNRKIVFVTYQSSAKLAAGVKRAKASFDLAILDEAHKTVGVESKAFATLLFDARVPVKQRIFMTATERVYRGSSDDVLSMDDESRYGQRFYQLTFKDAINATPPIISDYKILTVTVSDEQIESLIRENRLITGKQGEIEEQEAQSLAAGIALARAVKKRGIRHAISFHRSIRSAQEFADQQTALVKAGYLRPRVINLHISSKKTAGQRAQLLDEFQSESRALMTNARCLTEGVDVPAIDCVLFADPKQSVIDIVQAAGRALRPHEGKPFGYIMLPLIVPNGMDFGEFAETTAFRQVAKVVTALSTQDERIAAEFRTRTKGKRSAGRIVEIEGDIPKGMKLDLRMLVQQIEDRIWQRVGRANWRPFSEAREFVSSLHLPNQQGWVTFAQSDRRPPDIPSNPQLTYRNSGWAGFGDWLGTGTVASRNRRYRSFSDSRAFVRSLGLRSGAEWREYSRSGLRPFDIPGNPYRVYASEGWAGMGDWLGTHTVASYNLQYRPFDRAREFVRRLGLKSQKEWQAYCRSGNRPSDIPATPAKSYADVGWKGFGDWLGTGTVAPRLRRYRPFARARAFVRTLGLKNGDEWRGYCHDGQCPADIPAAPWGVYANKGWSGMGDWLGTGQLSAKDRSYRSFTKARAFVRRLGLKSGSQWAEYCRSGKRPSDIPQDPRHVYSDDGWVSMGDWLGTGRVQTQRRKYRLFLRARAYVRKLGLTNLGAWQAYCRSGRKPSDIPANPRAVYAEMGWVNLGDWLGTGTVAPRNRQYRSFGDARAFVRQLRLDGNRAWRRYCESGKKPEDIPATPDRRYKGQGWAGWGDWFGTGIVAPYKRTYRAFADARAFVRRQNLKSNQQWREYCRRHQCPEDIPAAPDKGYKDKGWVSWGDWLGTGVVSVNQRKWRSFKDARRFARGLGLSAQSAWRAYSRAGRRPSDIPSEPGRVYAGKGWISWPDWLGTA